MPFIRSTVVTLAVAGSLAATLILSTNAHSQTRSAAYPAKPIAMVVPFAAGGGVDILTRILGQHLGEILGQPIIVEDRPGAGGIIGSESVAKAAPDGYTLLVATTGTHTINPGLYSKMPFDAVKDFAPITLIASVPNLLVVNPGVPAKDVHELVELAKASPGKLSFGSFGNGTSNHLSGELLKSLTGTNIVHVPYKSAPQAVTDLIAGRLTFAFVNMPVALPQVAGGKLRALAVTGAKRSSASPEYPTMSEAGVPGFVVESWYGLMAPAGTPEPIVRKLYEATVKALALPDVRAAFAKQGADVETATPSEFAAMIPVESARWSQIIRKSGAHVE
jgi:tripartite-type tricarboxylate transporter receptor subunit TctC